VINHYRPHLTVIKNITNTLNDKLSTKDQNQMKTIIVACILVSATGCASSTLPRASTVHNTALDAEISKSLDKQEINDKLRVGRTHYNWSPYYKPGTSILVKPYNPAGL